MNWFNYFKKTVICPSSAAFHLKMNGVTGPIELSCNGLARLDNPAGGIKMEIDGVPLNLSSVQKITVNIEANKFPVVIVEYI